MPKGGTRLLEKNTRAAFCVFEPDQLGGDDTSWGLSDGEISPIRGCLWLTRAIAAQTITVKPWFNRDAWTTGAAIG